MARKQRPTFRYPQATDAHDSGTISCYLFRVNKIIRWQCEEKFQSRDLLVFLTFILIVVAFSAFVLTGIYIDGMYGPGNRHLALHFDSFSVIDFRVMEKQLVANWTAKFVFINKRKDIEVSIEPFDLLAFYKRNNLVSCASVAEPLVLKPKYQAVVEVEFSPEGCNKALSIDDEVLQEIEEDRKKGKISLNLKLDLEAKQKGSIWGNRKELAPSCDLDLEFNSTKLSTERFSSLSAKNCRIPLPA